MSRALSSRRVHRQKRQRVALIVVLVLAWLVLVCIQAWSARNDRLTAVSVAQSNSLNLASSLAQHAGDTFRIADTVLSAVVARWQEAGEVDEAALHRFLVDEARRSDRIHGLFVYDRKGQWINSSLEQTPVQANNRDRSYFLFHERNPSQASHISGPFKSRSDGTWIVVLSRRLDDAQGKFDGVVIATVQVNYFEGFYGNFNTGKNGTIGMTSDDGTVLARLPYDETIRGKSIAGTPIYQAMSAQKNGTLQYVSPLDGASRISGFAQVEGYPLKILAGVSEAEALAPSRNTEQFRLWVTLLAGMLFGAAGWYLDAQIRRTHRSEEKLSEQALQDALTGLFNRRAFDQELENAILIAQANQVDLTVMLVDVDHFKLYNDHYGHAQGDTCLRQVAQTIAKSTRRDDLVARYGGEEFGIIMLNCDAEEAKRRGSEIVGRVQALGLPHALSKTATVVSISLGGVTSRSNQVSNAISLIARADEMLYEAKRNGRGHARFAMM